MTAHLPDIDWPITRPFWEGCRDGVLHMPRCDCGAYVWYPQPRCPRCRGARIEWVPVSGEGRLFTWTTVHRAFLPGHESRLPYTTGIVELVEDPVLRMTAFIAGSAGIRLTLGMLMTVRYETIETGIVIPVFAPKS